MKKLFTRTEDVSGTSLRGRIKCQYRVLKDIFGEPSRTEDESYFEWHLKFMDGTIATIYDRERGYRGSAVRDPEINIKKWNLGGRNIKAAYWVLACIEARGDEVIAKREYLKYILTKPEAFDEI